MQEFSPPYGEIELITKNIRRITAPNPAPYTFKGTGTYIIGHGYVAVIDPGPDITSHIDAILTSLGDEKISHILITHNHKDHSPAAKPLAEKCGAKIYGFDVSMQQYTDIDAEEGIDKNYAPDVLLKNDDIIKGQDWTIEAIHTPGHLSNHICFAYREEKSLFTGDHVMGWSTTIISPPDGNMADYLESLEKLRLRDDKIYYPTHGLPINNPKQFVTQLIGHRLRRDKEIIRAIAGGASTIEEIVGIIYATIDKKLYLAASRTTFAHLIRLVDLGHVKCGGKPSESSHYKLPIKNPAI